MRTPVIAANWKMHKTVRETRAFAEELADEVAELEGIEVVVAPPFTALETACVAFGEAPVYVAAQNVHDASHGAYTGEISVEMLRDLACSHVILGHSERRSLFGESDEFISRKLAAVQAGRLRPILCVGEQLAEREAGTTLEVLDRQLAGSLAGADAERAADLVIAYEPVWAIGTGKTATPEIAQEAHAFIRGWLEKRFGGAGAQIRVLYGGSVKPDNTAELMAQPDIDGALVGGASLDPESFSAIIRNAIGEES